jgi:hypothetical protein
MGGACSTHHFYAANAAEALVAVSDLCREAIERSVPICFQ